MSEQGAADPGGAAGAADEETGQVVPRHAGKTRDVSAGFVNGQLRLGEQAGHQGGVPVPMVWRDKGVGLQIAGQPEVHQRGQVVRAEGSDHGDSFLWGRAAVPGRRVIF